MTAWLGTSRGPRGVSRAMTSLARVATALALTLSLAAAGAFTAPAAGDGLPAGVSVHAAPLSTPGGLVEYTTRTESRVSLVEARERGSERLVRNVRLRGDYAVPAVAYDGSPGGLSADGRTLVLIDPRKRFPRASTRFAILDAERLRLRRVLRLRGDFSFDALSPDGSLMYLIEYISPRDVTRYRVRVYDLRRRRLLPRPIVDPSEPPDEMSGIPVTRAMSPNGRWAYTLYDGAEHPFVHALDTERRRAVCVDLHLLGGRRSGLAGLRMSVPGDGSPLAVEKGGRTLASIDTTSFEVSEPDDGSPPSRDAARRGLDLHWLLLLAAVPFALGLGVTLRSLRRRQAATRLGDDSAARAMLLAAPSSAPAESSAAVARDTSRPVRPPEPRSDTDAVTVLPPEAGDSA
jgi:hypothetical protein